MGTHLRYLRSSRQATTPVTTAFNRYTRSTYSTLILRPPPTPPPLPLIPSTCVSLLLSLPLALPVPPSPTTWATPPWLALLSSLALLPSRRPLPRLLRPPRSRCHRHLAPPSALAPAPLPLPPARPTPALPTRPTSAPLLVSWLSSASSPLSKFLS